MSSAASESAPEVAIFGGSFNPPHVAHVLAVAAVLSTSPVNRVIVVPTFQHPFAKALAPYDDRVEMCRLAMAWLPGVEISRLEQELGGESRTLRTVQHLKEKHPEWRLRLVMGADILTEAPKWYRFDEVCRLAPPLVLGRAGVSHPDAPAPLLPEVSSTEVRDRLAKGDYEGLALVVPRAVLAFIRERGLYRAQAT
jgi:nicotinate-nucleotide adenylyltransferase